MITTFHQRRLRTRVACVLIALGVLCLYLPEHVQAQVYEPFGGRTVGVTPCYSCADFGCFALQVDVFDGVSVGQYIYHPSLTRLKAQFAIVPGVNVLGNGWAIDVCFTPYKKKGKWKWNEVTGLELGMYQVGTSLTI